MDGEDCMRSAAGIVDMCSCCDSRKKSKPYNYIRLISLYSDKAQINRAQLMKMKECENLIIRYAAFLDMITQSQDLTDRNQQ